MKLAILLLLLIIFGRWFNRGFAEEHYQGYTRKAEAVNKTATEMIDLAVAWNQPFFACLHYCDPHTP